MDFKKKYDIDAMLNGVSDEGDISDNAETEEGDKTVENGEKNLLKKPLTVEEHRALRRKTKRTLAKQNSKEGSLGMASAPNFIAPQRRWKNSRRSRNGYGGRGLTKKAGGGKGNWGKFGSEFLEEYECLDSNDPNFDDDDLENVEFTQIECSKKMETDDEFLKHFEIVIQEYYEHGDTHEVCQDIDEQLKSGTLRPFVVRKAVEMALEHKNSHREMTSVLLSDLYGRCLIESDYEHGFDMLLNNLPDLVLDTPDAAHLVGNFIARAVADDCLMPKYVHLLSKNGHSPKNGNGNGHADSKEPVEAERTLNEYAQQALDYAEGKSNDKNI
jgi:programmed cell death protein 4